MRNVHMKKGITFLIAAVLTVSLFGADAFALDEPPCELTEKIEVTNDTGSVSFDTEDETEDAAADRNIDEMSDIDEIPAAPTDTGLTTIQESHTATDNGNGATSSTEPADSITHYENDEVTIISYTGETLAEGTCGATYTASVAAATNGSGTGTYTYETVSALPAGITLLSTGTLTGTPTETGSYEIVVTATDGNSGTTANATFLMTINAAGTVEAPTAGGSTAILPGDMNQDGKYSFADYEMLKSGIIEGSLKGLQREIGDYNSDGKLTAADYRLLMSGWLN